MLMENRYCAVWVVDSPTSTRLLLCIASHPITYCNRVVSCRGRGKSRMVRGQSRIQSSWSNKCKSCECGMKLLEVQLSLGGTRHEREERCKAGGSTSTR